MDQTSTNNKVIAAKRMEAIDIEKEILAEVLLREKQKRMAEETEQIVKRQKMEEESQIRRDILLEEKRSAKELADTREFQRKEAEAKYLLMTPLVKAETKQTPLANDGRGGEWVDSCEEYNST